MVDDLRTAHKNRILSVKDLPTLPRVLDEVTRLIDDPDSSMEDIAKVISLDQVLSAKVLRMANSPIYGLAGSITSVQHALVLLGCNVIRGIIISTSVFDTMINKMVGLWEHSLGCAMACHEIAKVARLKDPEEYSVAGLLHDLGKVVVAVQIPEAKDEIDKTVAEEDASYYDSEQRVLGIGHDRINSWLADHWNLPVVLKEGMSHHHTPSRAEYYPTMASVVHLGDFMVRLFEFGNSGDEGVHEVDPQALSYLGLDFGGLTQAMDSFNDKLVEISSTNFV
jgi:HD-like signal output (HDOD) protein